MSEYIIGMDGGGTKTKVLIADRNQTILEELTAGAINYNGAKKEEVDQNIQGIFHTLEDKGYKKDRCRGICIGTAGISNPLVTEYMKENINHFGYTCSADIVGDHETALAGALMQTEGIIVIAGTGSICYGKDQCGNTYRTGGFGHLIDDEGSGYAIGRDILSAVVRAHDKRAEDTVFTKLVFEYLHIRSIEELIRYVYNPKHSKKEIAKLSILIDEAYRLQDTVSVAIMDKCVRGLVDLTRPILNHMNENCLVAAAGSVLLNNENILEKFTAGMKREYPDISIIKPKKDAAYGAVILAAKLSGED
ncbi:BadF/BadG/BcrA/BcrD ATPase family protein [Anaerocolumna aminovalerica]|uniref:BadF/BadG/BcrA/BcrD ATPase family protein n=1 Tax=Anaerocolumna aminovalerica TaxID=1527 RepID=UPI000BE3C092|nr:BadF/BadG/BcrA/BcrD ATPase family protein [Anaerocolumna aminovalerica]